MQLSGVTWCVLFCAVFLPWEILYLYGIFTTAILKGHDVWLPSTLSELLWLRSEGPLPGAHHIVCWMCWTRWKEQFAFQILGWVCFYNCWCRSLSCQLGTFDLPAEKTNSDTPKCHLQWHVSKKVSMERIPLSFICTKDSRLQGWAVSEGGEEGGILLNSDSVSVSFTAGVCFLYMFVFTVHKICFILVFAFSELV